MGERVEFMDVLETTCAVHFTFIQLIISSALLRFSTKKNTTQTTMIEKKLLIIIYMIFLRYNQRTWQV